MGRIRVVQQWIGSEILQPFELGRALVEIARPPLAAENRRHERGDGNGDERKNGNQIRGRHVVE